MCKDLSRFTDASGRNNSISFSLLPLLFLHLDGGCDKQSFRWSFKSTFVCVLSFRRAVSGPASPVIPTALCKHWRRLDKQPSSTGWQSSQNLTLDNTLATQTTVKTHGDMQKHRRHSYASISSHRDTSSCCEGPTPAQTGALPRNNTTHSPKVDYHT